MMSQLLRYAPVISLIQRTRPQRVLEVGCGSQGLGKFFPHRFVGADRDFSDYTETERRVNPWMLPVRADGAALPFKSQSFDLVVLLDVLEHLPQDARPALLAECDRVAIGWIAVGFPCDDLAGDHDREFHGWLRARSLSVPAWLLGHLQSAYPTVQEVCRVLSGHARRMRVLDNAWLPAHRLIMRWEVLDRMAKYSAALSDLLAPAYWNWRAHRAVTNLLRIGIHPLAPLLRLLDRPPGYRKFVIVQKEPGVQGTNES